MSYYYNNDDRYAEAERQREIQTSRAVKYIPWQSDLEAQANASDLKPFCEYCNIILVMKGDDWFCTGCGNRRSIEEKPKQAVAKPNRFKPKQNAKPSLIIASQKRKPYKKTPLGSLPVSDDSNQELRRELESLGVVASTASEVNEY